MKPGPFTRKGTISSKAFFVRFSLMPCGRRPGARICLGMKNPRYALVEQWMRPLLICGGSVLSGTLYAKSTVATNFLVWSGLLPYEILAL